MSLLTQSRAKREMARKTCTPSAKTLNASAIKRLALRVPMEAAAHCRCSTTV